MLTVHNRKRTSMSYKLPILLLIPALFLSACNVGTDAGSESQTQNIETPESLTTPAPATQSTLLGPIYTDTRIGFTFNYPEGWIIWEPGDTTTVTAYAITLQSFDPGPGGGGSLPEGESKIDVYVNPADTNVTLEAIETRLNNEDGENDLMTIASIEPITLAAGMAGLLVRGEGMGGPFVSIHTLVNGFEVSINLFGDEQDLWYVADSLRPN